MFSLEHQQFVRFCRTEKLEMVEEKLSSEGWHSFSPVPSRDLGTETIFVLCPVERSNATLERSS